MLQFFSIISSFFLLCFLNTSVHAWMHPYKVSIATDYLIQFNVPCFGAFISCNLHFIVFHILVKSSYITKAMHIINKHCPAKKPAPLQNRTLLSGYFKQQNFFKKCFYITSNSCVPITSFCNSTHNTFSIN